MPNHQDNYKAGLFVIAGIALTLIAIFALADFKSMFQGSQTLIVSYSVADGLGGLKVGADVTLGDRRIGQVTMIDEVADEDEAVTNQWVYLDIPAKYKIYENAVVELVVPTLGSGTRLNIRSTGRSTDADGTPVAKNDGLTPIAGSLSGSNLTKDLIRDLGIREKQKQQMRDIIDTVHRDLPEITGSMSNLLNKTEGLADDARATMADARETVNHMKDLTAELTERRKAWFDRIDAITKNLDETLATANQMLGENDPDIRAIVENTRTITDTIKNENLIQLTQTLENLKVTTDEAQGFMASQTPVLARTLANLQLTADQLKLAGIEVRRSPWRLLYNPDKAELNSDNIYDAARSFALAAGSLENATSSLQGLAINSPEDAQRISKLIEYLEAVFDSYRDTEKKLFDALPEK